MNNETDIADIDPTEVHGATASDDAVMRAQRLHDALFGEYAALAAAGERAQERQALAWACRNRPDERGLYRVSHPRLARPAPCWAGLRTRMARVLRHMDTPQGRLLFTVRMACGATLLPGLSATDKAEHARVNAFIGRVLRLDEAVAAGLLANYLICWSRAGRWPRRPKSIRVYWSDGKDQGERIVGDCRSCLERLIKERTAPPRTHFLNGRQLTVAPRWRS